MQEFAYIKQIEKYRKQYEHFPLPIIICDRALQVYWANQQAKSSVPAVATQAGVRALMRKLTVADIWSAMARGESLAFGVEGRRVVLLPVTDAAGVTTGVMMFLFEDDDAVAGDTIAQTVGKSLRETAGDIFEVVDDIAAKADLLRAGWIHSRLNRLLRVAENFTEYARLQSGDCTMSPCAADLAEYLEEITDTVSEIGRMAGTSIEFALPRGVCPVDIDRKYFELAFFNLLHNSLYYTRPGNRIRVAAVREQGVVRLSVQDYGVGIPAGQLNNIWRPYISYTHNGRGAGIGLGLAVVRRVADAHGARTELDSTAGEGTIVTLWLPTASVSSPLALRQDAAERRLDNRFSRLYVGLSDALDSPYREQ